MRRYDRGVGNVLVTEEAVAPVPPRGADAFMCRVLCVPDTRTAVSASKVQSLFSTSILISASRCLFAYVILPIITPLLGAATSVGPAIGIPISVVALYFDVKGIRRFWFARHRHRWAFTWLYLAVMALVTTFLVLDIIKLAK